MTIPFTCREVDRQAMAQRKPDVPYDDGQPSNECRGEAFLINVLEANITLDMRPAQRGLGLVLQPETTRMYIRRKARDLRNP
jgi:hypothetical protein